ncbi:glycoside hydrolase family 36 protein [Sphingomonas sp. Tas61C01]|uniref:glycoside hydrolase family 36 protein n=1 Tax=Sphingomonas sp. Tas61C01 TaxID=3458297 RepID=UPI00403EC226
MTLQPLSRRQAIARLMAGAATVAGAGLTPSRVWAATRSGARLTDGTIGIEVDTGMRTRISRGKLAMTGMDVSEAVRLTDGSTLDRFVLIDVTDRPLSGQHGSGRRHDLRGTSDGLLEKRLSISFLDRYPGLALLDVSYRNVGDRPIGVAGWRTATHDLLAHRDGAWSFAGASYPDRRDWVQKVAPGFEQRNFMGMNGSDYGGGTPVASVWRRDVGLAVGHVEPVPRLVSLPVAAQPGGTRIGMSGDEATLIQPGATLDLPTTLIMTHEGDHFAPLDAYRRLMAERGLAAPRIPASSYAPIWCAWGYERNFTTEEIYAALPKAKEVGLEWAVLDDGWQTSEGDWKVDRKKFPRGDADMKAFADRVKAAGMKPRLWLAPLAVDPGTDLLRDHADMLLLDRQGAAQNVSWWNSFTMCPAYQPTIDLFRKQVRQIIGEWGYEGLKLDGQHLNGVAPCYNPAHRHARPEESFEKLQDFWKALYDEAIAANPEAIVEICPCGDSFAFHNIPAMNHTPASDPTSSWQVRLKGKTFKALMGPAAPFAGDHVELSDRSDDFASTYGIGGIPSTKFTWPRDSANPSEKLPAGGFVLTADKEVLWRKWIALYRQNMLAEGEYLGGLYDIGFDKPEAHAVAKGGKIHYAFYADSWSGDVTLRGLGKGRYALKNAFTGTSLGMASQARSTIPAKFDRFLLVEATPVDAGAAA